ncbi:unnamed protein product [Pylaiella littoralis]
MASGAKLVLPMVVLNMGGEMVNILHQRLNAQSVEADKRSAVLRDVICTMYAPKFIEELFKPQDMYSEKATKEVFFKLAHSSIMRLNETSMSKLFDLITMGLKYQALSCAQPQQLLQVTLNHSETLKKMVPSLAHVIDAVIEMTVAAYRHVDTFGWMQLRHRLLEVFQGRRVKISLFLQYRVQLPNGVLVLDPAGKLPVGAETPGMIRYLGSGGEDETVVILPMAAADTVHGSLKTYIDFESPMGTNIYEPSPNSALDPGAVGMKTKATEAAAAAVAVAAAMAARKRDTSVAGSRRESKETEGASTAMAGLNLLASLLGASAADDAGGDGDEGTGGGAKRRGNRRESFKINLFPDNPFDGAQAKDGDDDEDNDGSNTITIDLASTHTGCAKMLRELDLSDDVDGNDGGGGGKSVDGRRTSGGGGGGGGGGSCRAGAKGGGIDDDELDDLLDLMDSTTAESK